jgi:CheY-like chemotaxis protein
LRFLAAEDVEINRLILEDLLEHEGATVVFAENGQQALERLAEHGSAAFDLVLMDIQMPVMDGHAASQRLREIAPALPVIGLTAHALAEERDKCLASGMVDHVGKPFDPAQLVAAILRQVSAHPAPVESVASSPEPLADVEAEGSSLIDWAALHQRFQGRTDFIRKLLRMVQESHADTPDKLRQAAREGDTTALAHLTHSLKGLIGSLDALAVYAQARAADEAARAALDGSSPDSLKLAGETAEKLAEQLQVMLQEITRHLDRPDHGLEANS